jgi:hypothetical protein
MEPAENIPENVTWFEIAAPVDTMSGELTRLPLVQRDAGSIAAVDGDEIVFTARGWYEVLLTVEWDPRATRGRRFSHSHDSRYASASQ